MRKMSKILVIKHLPTNLSRQDKERLLRHFGAVNVWETVKKPNMFFASFSTKEEAESVLHRLHQLEIGKRRLVVEYSYEKESYLYQSKSVGESVSTNKIRDFLRLYNAWNPSVDFYQPPPAHLVYNYTSFEPKIAMNIIFAMFKHKPFYIQAIHLMNKMCLESPFSDNPQAMSFFKETFHDFLLNEIVLPLPENLSESESEIESSEESDKKNPTLPSLLKRQHTLKNPMKRKSSTSLFSTPSSTIKVKKTHVNQAEVFDVVTPVTDKRISVVIDKDILHKSLEQPEVIGELGKFDKELKPLEQVSQTIEEEQPTITRKELLKNRLSYKDMKLLPIYKNYTPGQPSMRLYLKNLAKTVKEKDVIRIYRQYIEDLSEEEQNSFDVRVMQEGRMKGQGFVTFPSVKIAETALNETNGFILQDKPMVVQFARVANKKTVD